jgi:hypothetical protein
VAKQLTLHSALRVSNPQQLRPARRALQVLVQPQRRLSAWVHRTPFARRYTLCQAACHLDLFGRTLRAARLGALDRGSAGHRSDAQSQGASLRATEQPIDTSTAVGKCFLDMLDVFAEFETNLRRERQLEGIAKAKVAGIYKGRPASIDAARVRELKAAGMGPTDIAKVLKIGRASVYRVLEERAD